MDINLTEEERIKILNSDDLYGVMQRILLRENKIDQNREHFWVIGLEVNNRILFIELISLGTVNRTIAEPMEVFSLALQKRAVHVILCHNHPSGELQPSQEDRDLTDRLIQVGRVVKTAVLDHLIISERSYYSFADTGLLAELQNSIRYVPPYELIERLQREAQEILDRTQRQHRRELRDKTREATQKSRLEVAKKLKRRGESDADIAELTGLSLEEVQQLRVRKS